MKSFKYEEKIYELNQNDLNMLSLLVKFFQFHFSSDFYHSCLSEPQSFGSVFGRARIWILLIPILIVDFDSRS